MPNLWIWKRCFCSFRRVSRKFKCETDRHKKNPRENKKEIKKEVVKEETVDYSKMTVAELKEIAKSKNISITGLKKAEIIEALSK